MLGLQATAFDTVNPPITGLLFKSQTTIPETSTLFSIYQNVNQTETRYRVAQALQSCFRFAHENIK
jgi:hypothetical protein